MPTYAETLVLIRDELAAQVHAFVSGDAAMIKARSGSSGDSYTYLSYAEAMTALKDLDAQIKSSTPFVRRTWQV